MELYPALDLIGGTVVRLRQGRFEEATSYDPDPLARACSFVAEGARWLHVVDLDGARLGKPHNVALVERLVRESGASLQVGGGLRSEEAVERLLSAGVARVVIGTAAFRDRPLLGRLLDRFGPGRIVVAVDVRDGEVVTGGWLEGSGCSPAQALRELAGEGVERFVYTDVERDGTLGGPAARALQAAVAAARPAAVVVSGGVASLEDLRALCTLAPPPAGVVVGKALYEHRFTVAEALAVLKSDGTV